MMKFTVLLLGAAATVVAQSAQQRLDGSGTTNPSRLIWEAASIVNARALPEVRVTYRAVGSSTGQAEFLGAENPAGNYTAYNDFGAGDIPISEPDCAAVNAAGRAILHFPFLLGAMSIFHSVQGLPTNGPQGLNMTGCLLAKIFNRDLTTWDASEILDINPGLAAIVPPGQEILVYRRSRGSSTTAGVTTYLHDRCPEEWPADQVGPSIDWAEGTIGVQGSGDMEEAITNNAYAIGYLDAGHGHSAGLAEIELENQAGLFQSSLEAIASGGVQAAATVAIEQALVPTDPFACFSSVSLHNQPGSVTWPIVAISYIYIDSDQTANGDKGALLKAFLQFLLSEDGQELIEKYNFVPVSPELKQISEAAIDAITLPNDQQTWSFEVATSPIDGMQDFVISRKRRDHYEVITNENSESLESETASRQVADSILQLQVDQCSLELAMLREQVTSSSDDNDDDTDRALRKARIAISFATVAFVIAVIALIVAMYSTFGGYRFCRNDDAAGRYDNMKQSESKGNSP